MAPRATPVVQVRPAIAAAARAAGAKKITKTTT
jgi:hypothetical protein